MIQFDLSDQQRKILETLARGGVMSPSQVSAETLIFPGEASKHLEILADMGLVLLRSDPDSPDGKLVTLSADARELMGVGSSTRQMKGVKAYRPSKR